jgi:hypothetical protein
MHLFVNNIADPDISDYEFDADDHNCIVFENSTASIGDLMVANRVYCPFECNTEHKNVFVHIPWSKNHKKIKFREILLNDFGT